MVITLFDQTRGIRIRMGRGMVVRRQTSSLSIQQKS